MKATILVALATLLYAAPPARAQSNDPTEQVTLTEILAHAEEHAPAMRIAKARLARGRTARRAADHFARNPEITVSSGARLVSDSVGVDLLAAIEQPIEIGGQRGAREREADRLAEIGEAELEETRWQVHRDVHDAYHDALIAREQLTAADRVLALAQELVGIAERRLSAGEVAPLAVRVAQADVAQAREARVAAHAGYEGACLALAELAGHEPPIVPVGDLPSPTQLPSDEELVRIALEHHPALRTRTAARAEARARLDRAEREATPTPTFGLSYGREAGGDYGPTNHVLLGTVRLELPLFSRNQAERAQAEADVEIADAEEEALRASTRARVLRAAAALRAAAERVGVYSSELLPALEDNLALVQRTFELGEIDVVLVSVARERFLHTQEAMLHAYGDYHHALHTLEAELGVDIGEGSAR